MPPSHGPSCSCAVGGRTLQNGPTNFLRSWALPACSTTHAIGRFPHLVIYLAVRRGCSRARAQGLTPPVRLLLLLLLLVTMWTAEVPQASP